MTSPSNSHEILPVEILELIYRHLDKVSLGRCTTISRQSHTLAIPHLYHTVVIDFEKDINPIFHRGVPLLAIPEKGGSGVGEADTERDVGQASQKETSPQSEPGTSGLRRLFRRLLWGATHRTRTPIPPPSHITPAQRPHTTPATASPKSKAAAGIPWVSGLPDRFSFTRHLTVSSHDSIPYEQLPHLLMPHLDTLRVIQLRRNSKPGRYSNPDGIENLPHTSTPCPLFTHLRPRRLVLGGTGTRLDENGEDIWDGSGPFPPPFVKELVVFAGKRCLDAPPVYGKSGRFLGHIPATVERLTLVDILYPPPTTLLGGLPGVPGSDVIARSQVLAWGCMGAAQKIEVVGLPSTDVYIFDHICRTYSMSRAQSEEEWQVRRAAVTFTSKEEYDQREGVEIHQREPAFIWERPNHLEPLSADGGSRLRWSEILTDRQGQTRHSA